MTTHVEYYTLSDGQSVPWLAWGYGTEFGKDVLDAGIRHIDTAQLYKTEDATGKVVKESSLDKADIFVTSKLSQVNDKPIPLDRVQSAVEETLAKLGFVPDLFLIHNPFVAESTSDLQKMWRILEDLKDEGKLQSLGVSNFRPKDLQAIVEVARYLPTVNQMEFHPYVLSHLTDLLAQQQKLGIHTAAYATLAPILSHSTGGPLKSILERIAKRINVDISSVLLLWLREHDVIAVMGTHNPDRLKNYASFVGTKKGMLSREEVEEIDSVGKGVYYRSHREHMTEDFPEPQLPDGTESA